MALGFATGSSYGNLQVAPDRTMSRSTKPRTFKIAFGDGYEQRIQNGINNIEESYSISLNNRPKAEIDDIVAFLDNKGGVSNFTFTLPDTNNTTRTGEKDVKVECEDYNTTYVNDSHYSLTATFRRVYEA